MIGVVGSLITAAAIAASAYEWDHHVRTNEAAVQVSMLQRDFDVYRWYQELQYLKDEAEHRPLSPYEKKRMNWLELKLKSSMEQMDKEGRR